MILSIFVVTFLAAFAFAQISTHDPYYCYAEDPIQPQRSMFSFVTQLDSVRGSGLNFGAPRISSCRPNRFWMLARGGSRLPNEAQIVAMRSLEANIRARINRGIDRGRANFCRVDRENLLAWTLNDTINVNNTWQLTETGFEEVRTTATRFQTFFPEVLPPTYDRAQFQFRHTYRERTEESARAFASGLFGSSADVVLEDVPAQDRLLRPIDSCPLYNEWIGRNDERDAFREGIDFENMLEQVSFETF